MYPFIKGVLLKHYIERVNVNSCMILHMISWWPIGGVCTCSNSALGVLRSQLCYDADGVHSSVLRQGVRDHLESCEINQVRNTGRKSLVESFLFGYKN